jgi:Zn-dependent protease with chaperone function
VVEPAGGPPPVRRLRRGLDMTAAAQLLALSVVWLGGALVVYVPASLAEPATHVSPDLVIAGWTLTGALIFVPAVERLLARVLLRVRSPTEAELAVMDGAWRRVCFRAGVHPERYLLRIENSRALNASAAGGHIVVVTAAALGLPPEHLEAVLAHELGHHLGGHAFVGLLHAWFGLPLRIVTRVVNGLTRVVSIILAIFRPFSIIIYGLSLMVAVVMACFALVVWVFLAIPVMVSTVIGRRSELRADRTAVQLGYGWELLALCQEWSRYERPPRWWRLVSAFLRQTHPSFTTRIVAIQRALAAEQGPTGG